MTVFSKTIVGKIFGGAANAVSKVAPIVGGAMSSVVDSIGAKKAAAKLASAATPVITNATVASTVKAKSLLSDMVESATGVLLGKSGPTVTNLNDIEAAARKGTVEGFIKGYLGWIVIGLAMLFGIRFIVKARRFRR